MSVSRGAGKSEARAGGGWTGLPRIGNRAGGNPPEGAAAASPAEREWRRFARVVVEAVAFASVTGSHRQGIIQHWVDVSEGKVLGLRCSLASAGRGDACSECDKVKQLTSLHPSDETKGRVCVNCYQRLKRS